MPPHRKLFLILAGTLLCCSKSIAQDSAPSARIVDRIDENNLVTLTGNTHPMARAQFDRGRVSPDLPMDGLVLVLQRSPQQQAEFDRFVASQSDPSSPNYHQWLEPDEVGERFGPAQSDIGAIENWLRGHGLTVGQVSKDRMTIQFGGAASQVESAFHTEIHNLDVKGVQHFANMSDPRIPAALASVVLGPKALHNFQPHPLHKLGSKVAFDRAEGGWKRLPADAAVDGKARAGSPRPEFGINVPASGGNDAYLVEDVTPYDFAAIYNVTPAWSKGIDGAGQTIAIAGTSEISASDVATFRSTFGLPPIPSFKQVVANGIDPGQCGAVPTAYCSVDDQTENSLDVEWSGAVAKGADIVLVVSGENASGSIDTVYASADYVIENATASILNVSYGLCELAEGTSGNTSYKNLWQTAYSEGIGVFVATGDSGSASCDEGGDANGTPYVAEYGLSVSGVASTPYDTAVGGTDFNWCSATATCSASPYWNSSNNATTKASALGYIPEVLWNDSCVSPWVLPYLQSVADSNGLNTPSDGEEACNFIIYYYENSSDSSLNSLVDTVGGAGGRSTCTTNSTTSTSTTIDPSSCKGGYAKPTWQAGVTGIPSSDVRLLPDVSFFASNGFMGSAYLICESPGNAACTYSDTSEPTAQEVGGTSASSPAMAGVMALINQAAGAPQGNPNAELYSLAAKQDYASCSAESVKSSSSCYFNDIDTSTNSQPCDWGLIEGNSPNCQVINSYEGIDDTVGTLEGYSAGRGFDLATGLGSLNVANVVNAWPASTVPAVTLSAASLTFTGTQKGIASGAKTITLKNSGHGALALNGTGQGIKITGTDATSFSETNTCGASVAIGASCNINVVFKPAATGTLTASLGIADNAFGSPQTVSLTGLGTAAAVTLSATGLTFPSTAVGGSASSQVDLSNTGTAALSLSGTGLGISIDGTDPKSFAETNNCGTSLGIGKKCIITVTFKPAVPGALAATLSIADNAPGSPQKISLSGKGAGPYVRLSHTSLVFAATEVGAASKQTVTLANSGTSTLTVSGITIIGSNPNSFQETNNCGGSVSAGKSCNITVTFKPTKTGSLSADVSISDGVSGSPQKIPLTGTGAGPVVSLSASSLTFPSTTVGVTAPKQSLTLTNKGNAKLGKTGAAFISITGTNPLSFSETNSCGTGLAPGGKCTISVTFKPGKAGALTAYVTFTDNAAPAIQEVKLTGTGK